MVTISMSTSLEETPDGYVPGVCNIGPAEIRRRRRLGWFGLAATGVLLALLIALGANRVWYLSLFLPAMMAAAGFLQAWFRFCARFGMSALFNFGELGGTTAVQDARSRAKDRRKAWTIFGLSALAGIAVSASAFALAG